MSDINIRIDAVYVTITGGAAKKEIRRQVRRQVRGIFEKPEKPEKFVGRFKPNKCKGNKGAVSRVRHAENRGMCDRVMDEARKQGTFTSHSIAKALGADRCVVSSSLYGIKEHSKKYAGLIYTIGKEKGDSGKVNLYTYRYQAKA